MANSYYVGYMYVDKDEYGNDVFEYIESRIKSVYFGKKGITVQTDRFRTLDYEDVKSNTKMLKELETTILAREPFFVDDDLRSRYKGFIENHTSNK